MAHWKDGVDPALFQADYRPEDKVIVLENIRAWNPKTGNIILLMGTEYKVRMTGGVLFFRTGKNIYDEAAVMPADFCKVKILT